MPIECWRVEVNKVLLGSFCLRIIYLFIYINFVKVLIVLVVGTTATAAVIETESKQEFSSVVTV